MQIGDYFSQIWSGGHALEEFSTEWDLDRGVVSCWVPSKEGQEFTVACLFKNADRAIRVVLLVDGEVLDVRIADRVKEAYISGNRVSSTEVRPFLFRSGRTSFDYDPQGEPLDLKALKTRGCITVEMTFVQVIQRNTLARDRAGFHAAPSAFQTIQVGSAVKRPRAEPRTSAVFEFLPEWGERPFATFHFKHRSLKWLQQRSIARESIPKLVSFSLLTPLQRLVTIQDLALNDSTACPPHRHDFFSYSLYLQSQPTTFAR